MSTISEGSHSWGDRSLQIIKIKTELGLDVVLITYYIDISRWSNSIGGLRIRRIRSHVGASKGLEVPSFNLTATTISLTTTPGTITPLICVTARVIATTTRIIILIIIITPFHNHTCSNPHRVRIITYITCNWAESKTELIVLVSTKSRPLI